MNNDERQLVEQFMRRHSNPSMHQTEEQKVLMVLVKELLNEIRSKEAEAKAKEKAIQDQTNVLG